MASLTDLQKLNKNLDIIIGNLAAGIDAIRTVIIAEQDQKDGSHATEEMIQGLRRLQESVMWFSTAKGITEVQIQKNPASTLLKP